jgi:nicotinate-nucleotide pyrophosphorylase (carboxylating)
MMSNGIENGFPAGSETDALVAAALKEDIGQGDATTIVTVQENLQVEAHVVARESGIVAGLPLLDIIFRQLDDGVLVERHVADGSGIFKNDKVATLKGPAGSILTGERLALNFLQHLCGIATVTGKYVEEVKGTDCVVLDTRKTLPGFRYLAKYAVRCGGGHNHRMGLYDRVMLKDNHWAAAGGIIADLVNKSRQLFPDLAIEVEVDTLEQLNGILPMAVEWILLDNFTFEDTVRAVAMRDKSGESTLLESSGNVDLTTIGQYAKCGVDAASVGRLTHSAPALDLGLDMGALS